MKKRNMFWGVIFVLAAIAILLSAFGVFPQVGWFSLLLSILLIVIFVNGIIHKSFFSSIFSIAMLYVIFEKYFPFHPINPWEVFGIALFLSIGLNMIFPKKKYYHWKNGQTFGEAETTAYENIVHQDVSFNSSIKYINSTRFEKGDFDCSFGSLKVYFNTATLLNNFAEIYLDSNFGSITLYIPKDWNIHMDIETCFGSVEEKGIHNPLAESPSLEIKGDANFGSIEIIYI